jgi:signal transduction histidine kinase/ActR/RegA family two-component response regulator
MNKTRSEDQIRVEQIRSIYRTSFPGIVTTLVSVFVLTGGLIHIDAATGPRAFVVLTIMFVQSSVRLLLYRAYLRAGSGQQDWRRWGRRFAVGAFIGGATIGCGSIWMVSAQHTELQLIALLLIFAVTGGAVGAFGTYLPAFGVFFVGMSVAPTVWLFMQRDGLHATIGGVFVLWFLAVGEQARRTSRQFVESIRLRQENVELVEDLRHEKAFAEEANVAKSRFLASASHDLRQPVHALSVFVGALRSHQMDAQARGLLDHIDGSVRALSGLFGGLLDISRLDAGVVEVNRTPFAIQPIIERVCRDFDSQAREKGVALDSQPTRAIVHSDPMLCERILRNIVANAVTYTDRGKVLVGCRRGAQLRLQIWDTGRGIAPGEQQHVFQEFYQIGNPERDRSRGVGLGLAIVKRLTTLLDHPLELKSWPGRGTCFTLGVPYASAAAQAGLGARQISAHADTHGSGLILVVDDEGAIQIAMQSLLQSWGYSVITAGSYAEMLERIGDRTETPSLIICDYRLRDNETGSMVIERLRNEYNDSIPGMLITGDTAPDRIKEAQASGYLLLHKPVSNAVLRAAIVRLMDGSSSQSVGPLPPAEAHTG